MEEAKGRMKEFFKKFFKNRKKYFKYAILLVIIIVLLAASCYFITVDDGTYKEDDWSSTPYGAGEYIKGVSINEDGTIKSNTTAQDLWDKMEKEKSSVGDYLKNPEELARIMKAEMVTQYPDLRPDPDQPINWEEIIKEPDKIQGIIKFKRAKANGETQTMSYVDKETLYGWIELYTETGEEKYKELALTHFTLAENDESTGIEGSNDWTSDEALKYNASDIKTDKSDAIVRAAKSTPSPGGGLCQMWVRLVYNKAGLGNKSFATAYQAFKANCVSKRTDNIPIGAAVYGTGSGSTAGHVGIYIGNGKVMDNVGTIKTQTLQEWIAWQEKRPTKIRGVKPGWLGWGWQSGHPKIISGGNPTQDETDIDEDDIEDDVEEGEDAEDTEEEEKDDDTIQYSVVVATWQQIDTTITSNDPSVEGQNTTEYEMTTTNINYGEMVESYTMPFDLLWALLVVGEDRNFIFELTDLIYNSDIQITVHDNLTVNTDIDEWHYTEEIKAEVEGTIKASCNGKIATATIKDVHENPPYQTTSYQTTEKTVTQTNTLDIAVTKANVWIVDYENKYTYNAATTNTTTSKVTEQDEKYPNYPNSTGNSFSCEHIEAKKAELRNQVQTTVLQDPEGMPTVDGTPIGTIEAAVHFEEDIKVKYYKRQVGKYDNITNIETSQKYIPGTPEIKEKTDEETAPNFVTIFKKWEYRANKSKIKDASSWLFEIIETNESTADKLDLVKYLLYKATGHNYGVKEYDFTAFYPKKLTSVGVDEGDYIVHTEMSSPDIVIKDVATLKKAFKGYSGSSKLVEHAQEFLDLQEQYHVNAVFAAAVSISETSAGRAGHATDGKNNWFNIECTCGGGHGRFETYSSIKSSIEAFYKQISVKHHYFTEGRYTVSEIGKVYCEGATKPGGWIDTTTGYMTQMFKAAGITSTSASGGDSSIGGNTKGEQVIALAKTKLGCKYVWGAAGPNQFDCSGFTMWCYKNALNISIPHYTGAQKNSAKRRVPVSKARIGDILWRSGHVGMYVGGNKYIHAPHTGDVVKISSGASSFTYALQFY